MSRQGASTVISAALACLLFAIVSTSGGVDLWGAPQWDPTTGQPTPIEIDVGQRGEPRPADLSQDDPLRLPEWIAAIIRVLLVVTVFATVIALLVTAWRKRPRLRWRGRLASDDFEVLPDVAAAVIKQAAGQRAALLDGTPRNAIVRCWLQLERDVAAVGLDRDPADTSLEFTERVLARYTVDPEAITNLATLYREARFSDHPLDESNRQAALDALDRLHHTLRDATIGAAP